MFWTLAISLMILVATTLAFPLFRGFRRMPSRAGHDVEVYGAQLRELQDDLHRSVLPSQEAASAKAEIGRRLLKAATERDRELRPTGSKAGSRIASVSATVLLVAALGAAIPFYGRFGNPSEPDQPLAARLSVDPAGTDIRTLVAEAEARLRDRPDDGRGWEALLPIYLRMGRPADAIRAADNALRLLGPTADRQAMKGEAEVQAASGEVTDAAEATFQAALRLDPASSPARFYLALRLSQRGLFSEAVPAWQAIIDKGPQDAPWIEASRIALDEARRKTGGISRPSTSPVGPQPGPSADQVAAASELSPSDRSAMVHGMVSQLAERLKTAPHDPEGWMRLIRSYSVLGDRPGASEAYVNARAVFADGSPERRAIEELAAGLGLDDRKAMP